MARHALKGFLNELVGSGAVSAAAAVVGDGRTIAQEAAGGMKRPGPAGRVTTSSLFDLASLTKPVSATLALALDRRRRLSLSTTIAGALRGTDVRVAPELRRRQLATLLRQRAGFQAWAPLYHHWTRPSDMLEGLISSASFLGAAPSTYSDLGFMAWAGIAEAVTGRDFATLVRRQVARPLGLSRLAGPPGDTPAVVECRLGTDREVSLARAQGIRVRRLRAPGPGRIQDGNARFLGGPSGHAGLFGSARAIWRLTREWARPRVLFGETAVEVALGGSGAYALGWQRRPAAAAKRSGLWYGHTGFTGGGVWFCPDTTEIRVLLTHRSSVSVSLNEWQARFLGLRF
ncbi:MAG: serine hydrolase domain-containing protein [Thermoanaerobaculia bacterium]